MIDEVEKMVISIKGLATPLQDLILHEAMTDREYANKAAAELASLRAALEEETKRTELFEDCLHRALALFQKAHPEIDYWPSGDVNFAWLFEQVKDASALEEARAVMLTVDFISPAARAWLQKYGGERDA